MVRHSDGLSSMSCLSNIELNVLRQHVKVENDIVFITGVASILYITGCVDTYSIEAMPDMCSAAHWCLVSDI